MHKYVMCIKILGINERSKSEFKTFCIYIVGKYELPVISDKRYIFYSS